MITAVAFVGDVLPTMLTLNYTYITSDHGASEALLLKKI
jgi:hypothetical protein